jgi:hypothetical protein
LSLAPLPSIFCFSYFQTGSHAFIQSQPWNVALLPTPVASLGHRHTPSRPAYLLRWGLTNFLLGMVLKLYSSNLYLLSR